MHYDISVLARRDSNINDDKELSLDNEIAPQKSIDNRVAVIGPPGQTSNTPSRTPSRKARSASASKSPSPSPSLCNFVLPNPQLIFGPGSDDLTSSPIDIGFNFPFGGSIFTQLTLSSNGFLNLNLFESFSGCCSGGPIPNPSSPNNIIAYAWTDLFTRTGNHSVQSFSDRFVVELLDVSTFGVQTPIINKLQVHLFPNGNVEIAFCSINPAATDTSIFTVGIENGDGRSAVAVLSARPALKFIALDHQRFVLRGSELRPASQTPSPTTSPSNNPSPSPSRSPPAQFFCSSGLASNLVVNGNFEAGLSPWLIDTVGGPVTVGVDTNNPLTGSADFFIGNQFAPSSANVTQTIAVRPAQMFQHHMFTVLCSCRYQARSHLLS